MIDHNGIAHYLPHRDPFLFLSRIEKVDFSPNIDLLNFSFKDLTGSSVLAHFYIDPQHLFAQSGGDGRWPSSLLIEAMAQSACFVLNCFENNYGSSGLKVALLSLEGFVFHRTVKSGDDLQILSQCTKIRGNIATFCASIICDEDKVCEGSFLATFSFSSQDNHAPGNLTDSTFN